MNTSTKTQFSIDDFVYDYVSSALCLARENITIDEFYLKLKKEVASKEDISPDMVLYLHHPFHWEFFLKNRNSPFVYVQNGNDTTHVRLARDLSESEKLTLVSGILTTYRSLLEERVASFTRQKSQACPA